MCGVARKRVEFQLSMSGTDSDLPYLLWRNVPEARIAELGIPTSWFHHWDDGWGASVSARVMGKGERRRSTAGFRGYDWMVDRILRWGDTRCRCEWVPDPGDDHQGKAWERCVHCRTSRVTAEYRVAEALMEDDEGEA